MASGVITEAWLLSDAGLHDLENKGAEVSAKKKKKLSDILLKQ